MISTHPKISLPELIFMRLRFRYAVALLCVAELADKVKRAAAKESAKITIEIAKKIEWTPDESTKPTAREGR